MGLLEQLRREREASLAQEEAERPMVRERAVRFECGCAWDPVSNRMVEQCAEGDTASVRGYRYHIGWRIYEFHRDNQIRQALCGCEWNGRADCLFVPCRVAEGLTGEELAEHSARARRSVMQYG